MDEKPIAGIKNKKSLLYLALQSLKEESGTFKLVIPGTNGGWHGR